MNQFKAFQEALEKMFPSLTVFSDLNWDEISREYIAAHDSRPQNIDDFTFNFPQFLQDKSTVGDCPVYLFELAYFELLQNQILGSQLVLPIKPGLHLNPSLSFLNLEYDVNMMLEEAVKGSIQVYHRPHILCIYRHPHLGLHHVEITPEILELLQLLETNPSTRKESLSEGEQKILKELLELGLVVEI